MGTKPWEGVGGRLLAIDYGSKRVGLAISDPLGIIAQGAGTLLNDGTLLSKIAALVTEKDVWQIVVGIPYRADGSKGLKAKEIEAFTSVLKTVVSVPIDTWDESFTSVDARRLLIEGGMKRKQRRQKRHVDEMAARVLLQEYLDCHKQA